MMVRVSRGVALAALLAVAACSYVAMTPAPLTTVADATIYLLAAPVEGTPQGGYPRRLTAGMAFAPVGTIAQGDVLRPRSGALTVEASDVHEAYIVVRDGTWVGFWLPYERAFSALQRTTPISLSKQ